MPKISTLNTNNPQVPLTGFGEVLTGKNIPHVAWRFDYGVNTRLVTPTVANGGTVTVDGSRAVLSTSANVAGSAILQTNRVLRYMPGVAGLLRFTAVFSTPKADSQQYIGIGNATDGFFIGYDGSQFGVMRRRGGSDFWTYSDDFNGDVLGFDTTKGNIFSITYQWLGFGYIQFHYVDPDALAQNQLVIYKLIHAILYPNTSADVHILNPTLPIYAEVKNTGNNTDIVLRSPSAVAMLQGGIEADFNPLDVPNSFDTSATFADTNNNHVASLRNDTTIGAITNRVPIEVRSITFSRSAAGAALTTFRIYRNATTAGALTFADVDANNSSAQTSATTTTITSVNAERAYALTSADTVFTVEFNRGELVLQPNETMNIGAQNNGVQSTVIIATINWTEQF